MNIETAFQGATGADYRPFDGICLTDTFALNENDDELQALFPDNSERRTRQKELDIRVIVGNPPWSVGQRSSADNNRNASYPRLEERISKTYATKSRATLKNSLYDSYKMAIRWASDRIGDRGVVAFVTNGYWLYSNVDSGLRACLAEEFTSVHVLNLRGNQRTQGERSRREGGKIFGQGSRAPVAISVLVRNPDAGHQGCRILYHDIGDYLTRERKLEMLRDTGSITGVHGWQDIEPDRHDDWIGQRDEAFETFYPLGSKEAKAGRADDAVFRLFSNGYKTGRDAYLYNFSRDACAENAYRAVENYGNALRDWNHRAGDEADLDTIVEGNSSHLRWDEKLKNLLRRGCETEFSGAYVRRVVYRPFVQQLLYADTTFSQRPALTADMFPAGDTENRAICLPGVGARKPFGVLMVDVMPDLYFVEACQCFPRYHYAQREKSDLLDDPAGQERLDNITDTALAAFRTRYGDPAITKDAIFDYVYGVLHAPDYRARFADDLSKTLPRVPFAPDFHAFAEAGRALVELHLGYETGPEYPLAPETVDTSNQPPDRLFGSRSMRLVGDGDSVLVVNDRLRLSGIPADAHRYEVNGRSPLGWFIDRYRVTKDKESGITNDPNAWFSDESAFIAAVRRIVHLSVETVRIVHSLPNALSESEG